MKKTTAFNNSASLSNNDALLITLFIAAIAHIIVILSVGFSAPKPEKVSRAIDITLVNTPAPKAPKEAKFLAQDNQIGAGEKTQKPEPPAQKLPGMGNGQAKVAKKSVPDEAKVKPAPKVITQQKAEKAVVSVVTKPTVTEEKQIEKHTQLTMETLQQQLRELGAEIRQREQSADQSKIKFVNAVSAHKYMAAQYMKDWEGRVERIGNLNYPEEAIKKGFSATLMMDVGVKRDGGIYSIRITRSSGNPALDEAAKKIVRMSAPFAPLPAELLKELDVLVIPRVWKFSDESGMTARQ
ncbi:MAG: TonB family protein [Methylococcales bacterium]